MGSNPLVGRLSVTVEHDHLWKRDVLLQYISANLSLSTRETFIWRLKCECGAYKKWTQETEKQPHTWNPGPSTTSKRNRGAEMGI